MLTVNGVSKAFGVVQALKDVSLTIREAEVHAVVGENGAGKSTLMNIIAGILNPDEGTFFFRDKPITLDSPQKAIMQGISIVFQEINLVEALSVAENIFLGHLPQKRQALFVDWKRLHENVENIFRNIGFSIDPGKLIRELSVWQKQIVQLARATAFDPELIIMDEPTAYLPDHETEKLFKLICKLRETGHSVIYISHKLDEVFQISDRITVLRDGQKIDTLDKERTNQEELISLMVGRALDKRFPKRGVKKGRNTFEVKDFTKKPLFEDVSFTLRKGEVIGFYGLVGSGRTELACTILGYLAKDSGELYLDGKEVNITSPKAAIKIGIGYLSEDRKNISMLPNFNVMHNITIASLKRYAHFNFVKNKEEKKVAEYQYDRLNIRAYSLDQQITSLSGGNQQKAFLGRILAFEPKIMILDEPTHGIDVGSKFEIYSIIGELAASGVAILFISSELPEILGISDRIIVMRSGKISGVFNKNDADQEMLLKAASHFESPSDRETNIN
ncbi:MAG: sugar ABC transporter ATP-binding protein [Desulfobacterales bacterium]|jgi:ABC-type sugar transport system ATPase subunit